MLAQNRVVTHRQRWLLIGSVVIANLPDVDFLPGILLDDPRFFHHQATHSLVAVVMVSLLTGAIASWWKLNRIGWGVWGGGLYLSHLVLDFLVNDPTPPFGVQFLWPFSKTYFISPITPFRRFDYFDSTVGVLASLLSLYNFGTIVWELVLMSPLVGLAFYIGKYCSGETKE